MKQTGVTCVSKSGTWSRISLCALAAFLIWIPLVLGASAPAQTNEQTPAQGTNVVAPVIPQQVRYAGNLITRAGDTVEAVFNIYAAQEGGEPLWTETQQVTVGADGSYTVLLGSATPAGLPQTLFAAGAARWLGVTVERAPELARVLLSSVPYAMKSADAQALSGHPAGDFVTQEQLSQFAESEAQRAVAPEFQPLTSGTITGSGITGKIPQFTGTNTIGDSEITQAGSDIGILEPTPAATLDVNGTGQFRGTLTLPAMAIATASVGQQSQKLEWNASVWSSKLGAAVSPIYKLYAAGINNNTANPTATLLFTYQVGTGSPSTILSLNDNGSFVTYGGVTAKTSTLATSSAAVSSPFLGLGASVFNSGSSSALQQNFDWQVIPTGNNTTTPSSNIALLYGSGSTAPAPTGLSISPTGVINWVPSQTFPITGTGGGTITGVTAGTALTGGGTSGTVTLNVDTTKVPLLNAANTFAASQALTSGDLSLGSTINATSGVINIGGIPFLHGFSTGNQNVFVGNAGNFVTTGTATAAIGFGALAGQTTGSLNTASGSGALLADTMGSDNTAAGADALASVTTGGSNTGVGVFAGPTGGTLSNTTALGANAEVGQSNSLVLGNTNSTPGAEFVDVGIGTTTPRSIFEAAVSAAEALGPSLTLTNPVGNGDFGGSSVDFNTYLPSTTGTYNPSSRIEAFGDGGYGDSIWFLSNSDQVTAGPNNGLVLNMNIGSNGRVEIGGGDTDPNDFFEQLEVNSEPQEGNGETAAIGAFGGAPTGVTDANGSNGIYAVGGDGVGNAQADFAGDGGEFYGGFTPESSSGAAGYGIYATGGVGGVGVAAYAGYFDGNIEVTGTVFGSVKDFKIDHPLDPANKYLVHTSVESSEMMNIYSGNVVTDELGLATVTLPDWFQAENTDFRYQLTVIGGRFAQAIVSKEVANNQFTINTNASNVKVSWQITAVRQDNYAKAHPVIVEQEKPASERGFYQNPELFGQPKEKQTEWARRPKAMQQMKLQQEARQAALAQNKSNGGGLRHDQPSSAVNRKLASSAPVVK